MFHHSAFNPLRTIQGMVLKIKTLSPQKINKNKPKTTKQTKNKTSNKKYHEPKQTSVLYDKIIIITSNGLGIAGWQHPESSLTNQNLETAVFSLFWRGALQMWSHSSTSQGHTQERPNRTNGARVSSEKLCQTPEIVPGSSYPQTCKGSNSMPVSHIINFPEDK